MKYFAILKDSLREALDSKVLYVLLGLAALIVLFVATLAFKPLPAEKALAEIVDGQVVHFLEALRPDDNQPKKKMGKGQAFEFDFAVSDYRLVKDKIAVTRGTPDSPDADYEITINKMYINDEAAAKVRANADAEIVAIRKYFARLQRHGFCKIGDIRAAANGVDGPFVEFVVEFQSTPGTRRLWLYQPSLFFGAIPLSDIEVPLGFQLFIIARVVFSTGSWIAVLLGVIITSFFIPNMLQKGSIDLLLVKPIRRGLLLGFKYVGGLTFILVANAFAIVGVWCVLGLRSGLWANWVLLLIPILTFFFAILYSVSTLMAVLTRSTVAAILVTIGAWFGFYAVGAANQVFEMLAFQEEARKVPVEERRYTDNSFRTAVQVVHRILPRTSDLDQLAQLLVFSDFMTGGYLAADQVLPGDRNWWESFGVSLGFIAVMLGLACWRFARKDY